MVRRGLWLGALLALLPVAGAARDRLAETGAAIAGFENGSLSATQAANRISNTGGEAAATEYLTKKMAQVFDTRRRAAYFDLLSMVATPNAALADLAATTLKSSDDVSQRLAAVRILGRMKNQAVVPLLTPLLTEGVLGLRREAARGLVALKAVKAAGALAKAAVVEDDPETRSLMIVGVGRLGDSRQAKTLEPLLESSSETTRVAATQALCLLGNKKGVDAARALLASKDKFERLQGVMLFEGAEVKVAKGLLEPMTTDPEPSVRARAARILAQSGEPRWIDWLVLEGYRGTVEDKLLFETELEQLRLSDEQRAAILKKAGLK
jgi:HEAT repeat protein